MKCERCGLHHETLNVAVGDGLLFRRARASQHRLRLFGGAWGFSARLIDAHLAEIERVQVLDEETAQLFECGWKTLLREGVRRVLDPRAGMQIILPLRFWSVTEARERAAVGAGPDDGADVLPLPDVPVRDPEPEQLRFVFPRVRNGWFENARQKRRRR